MLTQRSDPATKIMHVTVRSVALSIQVFTGEPTTRTGRGSPEETPGRLLQLDRGRMAAPNSIARSIDNPEEGFFTGSI